MLNDIKYTENDMDNDIQLMLQELSKYDINSKEIFLEDDQSKITNDLNIADIVNKYLRNIRYYKYAYDSIETEKNIFIKDNVDQNKFTVIDSLNQENQKSNMELLINNKLTLCSIPNIESMISSIDTLEHMMKQLKKDLERDRILINHIRIVGANIGIHNLILFMSDICDEVLRECSLPTLCLEIKDYLNLSILSKASRSHSGGIAFKTAQLYIDPNLNMLIPQSAIAPPIKINFQVGSYNHIGEAFNNNSNNSNTTTSRTINNNKFQHNIYEQWGLLVQIQCETTFKIQHIDMTNCEEQYYMNEDKIMNQSFHIVDNVTKDDLIDPNKNLYISILYEDYVLFPMNASIWNNCNPINNDVLLNNNNNTFNNSSSNNIDKINQLKEINSNLIGHIIDDWKLTATVVVSYLEK